METPIYDPLLDLQQRSLGRPPSSAEMVTTEVLRREGRKELVIRTTVALPDRRRVTVMGHGRELYSEGFDGKQAWALDRGGEPRAVEHATVVESGRRHGLWLAGRRSLNRCVELGCTLDFLSDKKDTIGRTLPAFRLRFDAVASKLLFLDRSSGQILVERDEFQDPDEEQQHLELHTATFEDVDGMQFPQLQHVVDVETGEAVAKLECVSVRIVPVQDSFLAPLS